MSNEQLFWLAVTGVNTFSAGKAIFLWIDRDLFTIKERRWFYVFMVSLFGLLAWCIYNLFAVADHAKA